MDRIRIRAAALTAAAALFAVACGGPSGGGTSETLAPDQTLRFALDNDVSHLDPGQVDAAVDITFLQNVFNGLVKYDEGLARTVLLDQCAPAGALQSCPERSAGVGQ